MMLLILMVVVGFLLIYMEEAKPSDAQNKPTNVEIVEVKRCPPHKWNYVEVKDTEGNTVKWKIVCDVCGPMQGYDKPTGGDY